MTRLWQAGSALSALLLGACPLAAQPESAFPAEGDRFIHVYAAQWSRTRFNQIVRLNTDFDDSWLAAVGVGRKYADLGPHSRTEWEVQVAKNWGRQDHPEVNGLAILRWHGFPWDFVVRNTIALGTGASYAFEVPAIEKLGSDKSTHLLQYLMLDITVAPPLRTDWELFVRVHHRSGAFGVVADSGSSNFVGLGVRRHY